MKNKVNKQRWYVITYREEDKSETVIGFTQALVFSKKEQAEKCFEERDYKKPKRNIRIMYF